MALSDQTKKWSGKCCMDGWIRLPEQRQKKLPLQKIK